MVHSYVAVLYVTYAQSVLAVGSLTRAITIRGTLCNGNSHA